MKNKGVVKLNMSDISGYIYLLCTILFTVYSQLVIRWRVGEADALPESAFDKIEFVFRLLLQPWVVTAIFATLLAGVSWMLTMTKLELSYAYPFVSLTFLIMTAAGVLLFGEVLSPSKVVGTILVMVGLIVVANG